MSLNHPGGHPSGPPGRAFGRALPVRAGDLLLLLIVSLGSVRLVGTLAGGMLRPAMGENESLGESVLIVTLALLFFQALVILAAIRALVLRKYGLSWSDLGLIASQPFWYRRAVILAIVLMPVVALVNSMIPRLAEQPFENPQIYAIAPAGFNWFALIGMTVMGGVVAPIAEEIAFRGLLYPWLRDRLGVPGAMVVSALCFALLHGVTLLIPALTVIGIALAWITERCGSLWPAIVTHGTFNTLMILALYAALASGLALPS